LTITFQSAGFHFYKHLGLLIQTGGQFHIGPANTMNDLSADCVILELRPNPRAFRLQEHTDEIPSQPAVVLQNIRQGFGGEVLTAIALQTSEKVGPYHDRSSVSEINSQSKDYFADKDEEIFRVFPVFRG
jgi:hypothetical protein